MSTFVKTKIKAAREALAKKDYAAARDASMKALEYEPENYNAYVTLQNAHNNEFLFLDTDMFF